MFWKRAGFSRKSLISYSSSTASSAPATSAKVTLGWSLLICFGLALPNCMTRLPPPCIWFSTKKKSPKSRTKGRRLNSSEIQIDSEFFFASTSSGVPSGPLALRRLVVSSSAYLDGYFTSYLVPSAKVPLTLSSGSLSSAETTSRLFTRSPNSVRLSFLAGSSPLSSWAATKSSTSASST